jgi:eukaryotic-like serine/threonine-protein kinase
LPVLGDDATLSLEAGARAAPGGVLLSGESKLPTAGADRKEASGELPGPEASSRRTPDESTVGMASSAGSVPESSGEADLPHLKSGELLAGRFTILRFIARGGMGAVYEANDVMLRSRVALKVIRGRIATDAAAMERFRREVLLARRVSHPNICRVYELYQATTATGGPIHFLTMELLEGETLSQRISRQGRLTTVEALPLAQQLCWGLAAAHSAGVIHRDFKSSNVILVPGDKSSAESTAPSTRLVITDFGIARAVQLGSGQTSDGPLTGGAAILGTPEYMAPEQVTGGTVTAATDIYALGVVLYEMVTGKLPFTGDTPLVVAAKRLNEPPPRPELATPGLEGGWSETLMRCLSREPERRFKSALDIFPELERPRRRWPRWATPSAVALALLLGAFAAVRGLPSLRKAEPPRAVVPAAPRPVLAILGFRDELASPELVWVPTAVSETLGRELATAETSLRVIPGDRVASVRRSLGIPEDAITEEKARERMQGLLAANVLVYGTLRPMTQGSVSVGLFVTMVDALSGSELAVVDEDLGPGAAAMADKVSSLADRLRQTMGASLSKEQATALSAYRPRNLSATRSYALGVMSLRKFEFSNAKSYFDAALATDGSFWDAQHRVVDLWRREGNRKKAREAAERLRSRSNGLTPRQQAKTEAEISELVNLGPEPGKPTEAWRVLFDASPDDVDLGLALIDKFELYDEPKTVGAIVDRLRELPAPASRDIRLDLAEAATAWRTGNPKHAEELLAGVRARAQAIEARTEVALALREHAEMLWSGEGRAADALAPFEQAARLLDEAGELDKLSEVRSRRTLLVSNLFPASTALKAFEELAALYRKLGKRDDLHFTLASSALQLVLSNDLQMAKMKLREALSESDTIGESPASWYTYVKGFLAISQADLEGARDAIQVLRTGPHQGEVYALFVETRLLREQNRLAELRETLEKLKTLLLMNGSRLMALGPETGLCALACEEGHPLEGLDCLTQYPAQAGAGTIWTAVIPLVLAKCRYLAADLPGTERAAAEARAELQRWGWHADVALANAYLMRVRAARGETAKAIASIGSDLAEAERKQAKALAFELALALGEVELRAGRPEGRTRLLKLEKEANAKEFFRIARLAREALDRKPAAAAQKRVQ